MHIIILQKHCDTNHSTTNKIFEQTNIHIGEKIYTREHLTQVKQQINWIGYFTVISSSTSNWISSHSRAMQFTKTSHSTMLTHSPHSIWTSRSLTTMTSISTPEWTIFTISITHMTVISSMIISVLESMTISSMEISYENITNWNYKNYTAHCKWFEKAFNKFCKCASMNYTNMPASNITALKYLLIGEYKDNI